MDDRRRTVTRNLRRVLGDGVSDAELTARVEATFGSYARYWIESFRLPGTSAPRLAAGIRAEGLAHLTDPLDAGTGVVVALPHLGGWEWAAFWFTKVLGYRVTAVVEQIEPPPLAAWFTGLRARFGINVVPLGPGAAGACAKALKRNHMVVLLCDRDISGGGIEVEFFGETTTLPGGPAALALRSGVPLVPAAVYHDDDGGHVAVVLEPVPAERRGKLRADVARVTQDLTAQLEGLIRRAPDQWHLMQPNWPSDQELSEQSGSEG